MRRIRFHGFRRLWIIAPLAILAMVGFIFLVMFLWNWLVPALFTGPTINFWQALGLLILSRILFGSWQGGQREPGRHWRARVIERWEQMTPEEREKFRRGWASGCGPRGMEGAGGAQPNPAGQ